MFCPNLEVLENLSVFLLRAMGALRTYLLSCQVNDLSEKNFIIA